MANFIGRRMESILGDGKRTNSMAREDVTCLMENIMMVDGIWIYIMGKELKNGKMATYTLEVGFKVSRKDGDLTHGGMVEHMSVDGRPTNSMVKGHASGPTESIMMVAGIWIYDMDKESKNGKMAMYILEVGSKVSRRAGDLTNGWIVAHTLADGKQTNLTVVEKGNGPMENGMKGAGLPASKMVMVFASHQTNVITKVVGSMVSNMGTGSATGQRERPTVGST
jgi:hypothetical protein